MKYNFEINKFNVVEENSNSQFTTVEIDVCRTGDNSHRLFISDDALKHSASSVKGKPILASFNYNNTEFRGHEDDEVAVGFFEEKEPDLVEKDGETYIRAKGKIWKRYFQNVVDIFKSKEGKAEVSMEVEMLEGKEPTAFAKGSMDLFSIMGCTLLGVAPSIKGSEARVLSFSEMKEEYNKETDTLTELQKFSKKRKEEMMAEKIKVNKTELKETPWSEVDKIALRDKVMAASNRDTLVKDVYALVEDGFEDAPSEHLKYPLMEISENTAYYNRYGLASALAYAKKENETSVINKVEKLYNKFKIDDSEEGEKKMQKEFAVDIGNMWSVLYGVLENKYPDRDYGSIYRIYGIYEEDNKKFAIIFRKDEEQMYRIDFDYTEDGLTLAKEAVAVEMKFIKEKDKFRFTATEELVKYRRFEIEGREAWAKVIKDVQAHEDDEKAYVESIDDEKGFIIYRSKGVRYKVKADIKVGKDDKTVSADIKWDTVEKDKEQKEFAETIDEEMECKFDDDEDKDDSDEGSDEDEDEDKEVKKEDFSYSGHLDTAALMEMLGHETEQYEKLVMDMIENKDMNDIAQKYLEAIKNRDELAKEVEMYKKSESEAKRKEEANAYFAELEFSLDKDNQKKFSEKALSLDETGFENWKNEVFVFAYKNGTKKSEDDFVTFGDDTRKNHKPNTEYSDVFEKYLNKK